MSAIVGVRCVDASSDARDKVHAMLVALAHRGPDGSAAWSEGPVSLGHLAFHCTPQAERAPQPFVFDGGHVVVTADARIDNRAELIARLCPGDRTASDAELIARAYLHWGSDCAERLIGDFAFAIWDRRAGAVFCARDPMGVKPLYYFHSEGLFAFGTEIKALFALSEVSPSVDDEAIALWMRANEEDRARTLYRHVRRLPAASTLWVNGEHLRVRRYWDLEKVKTVQLSSEGEYVDAFRELLAESVRARLPSSGPVGATLSGGLDSSSIVCMARHLGGPGAAALHTFSLIFPALGERERRAIDERAYMDEVIRGGGVQAHFVRGDALSPLGEARRMLWHLDEPFLAPNLYLHVGMFGAARANGVRVFLDGFDGDSAVSHGTGRLNSLLRAGDWATYEAEVRAYAARNHAQTGVVVRRFGLPYLAELARRGRWVRWTRHAARMHRCFAFSRSELATQAAQQWLPGSDRNAVAVGEREAHIAGISQPLYQLTLEMADKSAAAFGLEPRYPFFDRRVIEFCVGVPESFKFAQGWARLLLRNAMDGILPPEIQWRSSKANLSSNFHAQLRAVDRAMIERAAFDQLGEVANVAELEAVRRRYFDSAGTNRQHDDADGMLLLRATVLSLWLAREENQGGRRRLPGPLAA